MVQDLINTLLDTKDIRFPTLPSAVVEVTRVLKDPETTVAEIVAAIDNPTVAVRVLQVANSPAIRRPRQIQSLDDAIALLGRDMVKNIVICVSMRDLFTCRSVFLARQLEAVWHHSSDVATAAVALAKHFRLDAGTALSAGLLHDIGVLPVVDYYERHDLPTDGFDEVVRAVCAPIGRKLLTGWEFPIAIIDASNASAVAPTAWLDMCAIVSAAHYATDADPARLAAIGLTEAEFQHLVSAPSMGQIL